MIPMHTRQSGAWMTAAARKGWCSICDGAVVTRITMAVVVGAGLQVTVAETVFEIPFTVAVAV